MTAVRAYARNHRFAIWLTLIAIVGFLLRLTYTVMSRGDVVLGEGLRYRWGALLLANGQGYAHPFDTSIPDAGHPPAWTTLLAAPTKLGIDTLLGHRIFASIVGTATIVMVGVAARAALGTRAGLIAAALTASYPFVWLYEREVVSEPLVMLGIATMIWLAYRFIAAPSRGLALALGASVGLLAMTKSDQAILGVLLVAPLILSRPGIELRKRIIWLVLAGTLCIVIMAPWSIYLSTRFDRPVVLSGSIGGAMAAGNCAETYKGERFAYYVFNCSLSAGTPGVDPITRDEQARRTALEFMGDNKTRLPAVMAARVGRTFGFFRPTQQMDLETERGSPEWVLRMGFYAYWALLPLAIAGAVITRRRGIPIYPLLVFPILVVASVLLTIGSVRYRAPAEIPIVILAAATLDAAFGYGRRRRGIQAEGPRATLSSPSTGARMGYGTE